MESSGNDQKANNGNKSWNKAIHTYLTGKQLKEA
ncbi:hypothetical protein AYI69_g913, partial [Smittium culicis]